MCQKQRVRNVVGIVFVALGSAQGVILLLQTQSVLNLPCLARTRYMLLYNANIHNIHHCTCCLPNISGFIFKMHRKLQGLC